MPDRERRYDTQERPRDKNRSRSRSPRRHEKGTRDDGHRDQERERELGERDRHRPRSRSRSRPPRRRRDHSRSRSPARSTLKSRSRSPRRDEGKERGRDRRSGSRSRHRHKRRRSLSRASSNSELESSSSEKHRKKRKDKHRRKRSRSKDGKDKKKDKKEKKKKKKGAVTEFEWGKYGIINESNLYDKEAEFRTWLVEERKINPEILSKEQNKKDLVESCVNPATLPHEKFYDMSAYDRRMSSMRHGETLPITDSYDPNADMLAHSSAHKKPVAESDGYLNREQLQELRRVQEQRTQIAKMKLTGVHIGHTFGVRMDGTQFDE
ncbi:hypothetical protein EW145_g2269 [Phellinidium pouzarii]|uniref:Uncharacterized protein n=1 Tax=Phellinidium pouzarii TaxID=167371 RepID=A0A4S4LC13_9AGAM|nr:hypothetical protein EW145_g2269 [Phellinidium pouzarii]